MAQKKQTPPSSEAKESMEKKTSRRTFGKGLAGALAALPIANAMTGPGASALATELTDKSGRAPTRKEAGGGWNGAERFQAIAPALGTVLKAMAFVEESEEYAPVMEAVARSASVKREVDEAIFSASRASGATVDQITQWIDAFASLGKPGLMTDVPLLASDCAASLNGTWELTSRFSGGAETAARSQLYCDMDPAKGSGKQLITMWTEVNHFESTATGTVFLIGLAEVQYKQNGPYEVIGTSVGTTFGNFPGYEQGVKTTDTFRLVRRGQTNTMLGYPKRTESGGSDSAARTLVEVSGDPGTIKFKLWGALATNAHPRTMDTVDTYQIMSNRRPFVGGWESVQTYFDRVTREGLISRLHASDRELLRRACDNVPIPRGAR